MHLFYLDPGLVSNAGHHAPSCREVVKEARRRGIETTVLANNCIEAGLRTEFGTLPMFQVSPSSTRTSDPLFGWLEAFLRGAQLTASNPCAQQVHMGYPGPMYIDGKTIFVAGGTGMAGSAIVQQLLAASPSVKIRASFRSKIGHFIDDPRVSYEQADFRNADDCARIARGCDAAVLSAAVTGGARQATEEPWRILTDNVVLDVRLIEAVCLAGTKRVIYVSSATVYQEFEGLIAEDQLNWNVDPVRSYMGTGWVNRYAEKLCQFWHQQRGVSFTIARASNIFGPYGKFDPRSANFIPALIRKAVDRMDPFEVWGNPAVTRDVIYSEDFGGAVVALLNAQDPGYDIFNVGTGRRTQVGEVVDWALRCAGHAPREVVWRGDAPISTAFRALDCSKLTRVTGWRPAVAIEEGIARTTQWWQGNHATWPR